MLHPSNTTNCDTLPSSNSKVLFATDDPLIAWRLGGELVRNKFILFLVGDMQDALDVVSEESIDIFLTDSTLMFLDGGVMAEQVSRINALTQTVVLVDQESRFHTIRRFDHCSKFFVKKSVPPEKLIQLFRRLQAKQDATLTGARRQISSVVTLVSAITEGSAMASGGEVVVRSGDRVGRIYLVSGKIAWAYINNQEKTLVDDLVEQVGLSKTDLKTVFTEAKMSGRNFADTLIEWGIIEAPRIRALLKHRILSCIQEMAQWDNIQSIFAPQNRKYTSKILFEVDEIIGTNERGVFFKSDVESTN